MSELSLSIGKEEKNSITGITNDSAVIHEVSEEFSLPDYVPEVRRLLTVRAQVLPESKFISDLGDNSHLEFGGTVAYTLIYTNDDMELCSLPLSSSYDAVADLSSHPSYVFIDTSVDNVACRVNAPRKLTVKSRLKSRILSTEEKTVEEQILNKGENDELFMERLKREALSLSIMPISMQGIKVSDKLEGNDKIKEPLWCDARVIISDSRIQGGSVSVRGSVYVKCICHGEGGMITLEKTLPLAEEISAKGADPKDMARVIGRCISLSISNEENDSGNSLFFDLTYELEGEVIRQTSVELTRDCYSTKYETETEYKSICVFSCPKAEGTSFTLNDSIKRKNRDVEEIIDIIVNPVYEKAEFKGGKCIIVGKLSLSVIGTSAVDETGNWEYLCESYELPIRYNCDIQRSLQEASVRCDFSPLRINAHFDGDKLLCNAEIYVAYEIFEKAEETVLAIASLEKDKEIKKEPACVRVYFPNENDTVWNVAKKYHITPSHLKEANDLTSNSLSGVKSLIVH